MLVDSVFLLFLLAFFLTCFRKKKKVISAVAGLPHLIASLRQFHLPIIPLVFSGSKVGFQKLSAGTGHPFLLTGNVNRTFFLKKKKKQGGKFLVSACLL